MHTLQQCRLARNGHKGHDAVCIGFHHTLDDIGEQAPDVLHTLLLDGLAFHLGPDEFWRALAEGLLDDLT